MNILVEFRKCPVGYQDDIDDVVKYGKISVLRTTGVQEYGLCISSNESRQHRIRAAATHGP